MIPGLCGLFVTAADEIVSRIRQGFGAITVETFAAGERFGSQSAMQGGFEAKHKFAAEFLRRQRFG